MEVFFGHINTLITQMTCILTSSHNWSTAQTILEANNTENYPNTGRCETVILSSITWPTNCQFTAIKIQLRQFKNHIWQQRFALLWDGGIKCCRESQQEPRTVIKLSPVFETHIISHHLSVNSYTKTTSPRAWCLSTMITYHSELWWAC